MYAPVFANLGYRDSEPVEIQVFKPDDGEGIEEIVAVQLPHFLTVRTLKLKLEEGCGAGPPAKQRIFDIRNVDTPLLESATLNASNIMEIVFREDEDPEEEDDEESEYKDIAIVHASPPGIQYCRGCSSEMHSNDHPLCIQCMESMQTEWEMMEEDGPDDDDWSACVYQLNCSRCVEQVVTLRGMKVSLCSDSSTQLFSTDFVTDRVAEGTHPRKIETCDCQIVDIFCPLCHQTGDSRGDMSTESSIGYHVVTPCSPCLSASNNSHYWLFHERAVTAVPRLKPSGDRYPWSELPAFDGLGEWVPVVQLLIQIHAVIDPDPCSY
jgi:hypothetical protein